MSKASIMYSKIMIDVIDGGKPAIKVTMKGSHEVDWEEGLDVRDKLVRMFFDLLGDESSFVGVIAEKNSPNTKFLVPMDIPQTLEWLHRTFAEKIAKDEDSVDKVHKLFEGLTEIYYNDPVQVEPVVTGNPYYATDITNVNQTQ